MAVCCLLISINKSSELFRPAVKQQHNKGELQSVFHFVILLFIVYRSVEHAVLVVSLHVSKVAVNIFNTYIYKKYIFFRRLFLENSQIAKYTHGTKLNALENSFGLS